MEKHHFYDRKYYLTSYMHVRRTSLERYWLKLPLPSKSSLHNSNTPKEREVSCRIFSLLSMRRKDISKIATQKSSFTKLRAFFFAFSTSPEPELLTAKLSAVECVEVLGFDIKSFISTCKKTFETRNGRYDHLRQKKKTPPDSSSVRHSTYQPEV